MPTAWCSAGAATTTSRAGFRPISSSRELFQRVLDHPDDVALRQVLQDALLAEGDPRGELIALQLAADDRRDAVREAELVGEFGEHLLGGLFHAVNRARFEQGFATHVLLPGSRTALMESVGDPLWAMVRDVVVYGWEDLRPAGRRAIEAVLAHPVMRVRRLAGVVPGFVSEVGELSLTALQVRVRTSEDRAFLLQDVGSQPALEALSIQGSLYGFGGVELLERTRHLDLRLGMVPPGNLERWLEVRPRLEMGHRHGVSVLFDGEVATIQVTSWDPSVFPIADVLEWVDQLPARIEQVWIGGSEPAWYDALTGWPRFTPRPTESVLEELRRRARRPLDMLP